MKQLLILMLVMLSVTAHAQRERKIQFDGDTKTPVDSGFYGVGVINNQPYLINHFGDTIQFNVEYPYVKGWSTGRSLTSTVPRVKSVIAVGKDSVTLTLPSASDTSNRYLSYTIIYLGLRGGTGSLNYTPFDTTTYRLSFADSVFYYSNSQLTTFRTKVFDKEHTYAWFRIKPYTLLRLAIKNNKWYLTFDDFEY